MTEEPNMTFMITCFFITTEDFIECCHKVYFAVEDFTVATFIIANSVLYYLFDEKTLIEENMGVKAQYRAYRTSCKNNLATALGNLNIFISAKQENIEALLLGVNSFHTLL